MGQSFFPILITKCGEICYKTRKKSSLFFKNLILLKLIKKIIDNCFLYLIVFILFLIEYKEKNNITRKYITTVFMYVMNTTISSVPSPPFPLSVNEKQTAC